MNQRAVNYTRWLLWTATLVWPLATPLRAQEATPIGPETDAPSSPEAATTSLQPEPIPTPSVEAPAPLVTDEALPNAPVASGAPESAVLDEAALLALTESGGETSEAPLIRVYGFADFGIDKWFLGANGAALLRPTRATTFVFGNMNLYFDANPVENLRTMLEVRLTVAPHGEEIELGPPLGMSYERIDTTAFDFSSPSSQSQLRLGGVYIERAWSEYDFHALFKVRWGLFLTPFGIWNLDHGSPTLISLMLPTFISAQMLPTRLLGVHVYGSWVSGNEELGYALHVSNGRSPLDFDLSEDKALGGRVYYANDSNVGRLVLGASGYLGTYVDEQKLIDPSGGLSFTRDDLFTTTRTIDYAEQILGFDAALDLGGLRLRSEAVLRWVEYEGDKTEQIATADGSVQYLPSRLEWSVYTLAAYRTPWRIEPYAEVEVATKSYSLPLWAKPTQASSSNYAIVYLSAGVNVQLTTHTLFKSQLVWVRSYDKSFHGKGLDFPILFLRIINSF